MLGFIKKRRDKIMDETLAKIVKEIEKIQIWGFEDCPQRFQVADVVKNRCIKIVKKYDKKERSDEDDNV